MLILIIYSALFKALHFWFFIRETLVLEMPFASSLPFIAITMAQLLLAFCGLRLISNNNVRLAAALGSSILLGLFIHSTYMYFRIFAIPLDFSLILFASNIGEVEDSIFALISLKDAYIYSPDLLIIFLLLFKNARERLGKTDQFFLNLPPGYSAAGFFVLLAVWYSSVQPGNSLMEPFQRHGMSAMASYGPVGYAAKELIHGLYETFFPVKIDSTKISEIKTRLALIERPESCSVPFKELKPIDSPDFFIIQVESLMPDFLHQSIDGTPVLPELSRIASNSVFVANFFSHAISTSDSDFSFLTSLLPLENRFVHLSYYSNKFSSLPRELKRYGYHSIYASGAIKNFWNVREFNRLIGFDEQFSREDSKNPQYTGPYISDKNMFDMMLEKIASAPSPLMCMLLTSSSHHPFTLSGIPEVIKSEGQTGQELERRHYANAINYTDSAIGGFLRRLDEMGRLSRSVVIIYGDHPMMLEYQRSALTSQFGKLPMSHKVIKFINSRVPCMIYAPGILKPMIINKLCGQIDLAPTLLSILRKPASSRFLGNSIFSENAGYALHKYWSGRTDHILAWERNYATPGFKHYYDLNSTKPAAADSETLKLNSLLELSEMIIKFDYHEEPDGAR